MPLPQPPRGASRSSGPVASSNPPAKMKQEQQKHQQQQQHQAPGRDTSTTAAAAKKTRKSSRSLLTVEDAQRVRHRGERRLHSEKNAATTDTKTHSIVHKDSISAFSKDNGTPAGMAGVKTAQKREVDQAAAKEQVGHRAADAEPSAGPSSSLRYEQPPTLHDRKEMQSKSVMEEKPQKKSRVGLPQQTSANSNRLAALQKQTQEAEAAEKKERKEGVQQLLQQKNPVKAPDMQQLLLGDKRMPQRFADDDTAAEHWKVMPHIKKKDYLLQYTKAKDRKWTPRRGTANTGDEQQTNFDPKDMDMLCANWTEPDPKSSISSLSKAAVQRSSLGESEAELPDFSSNCSADAFYLKRLNTKEAIDTTLLETYLRDSWRHRQALHSSVQETAAYKREKGLNRVTDKLIESIKEPPKGILRIDLHLLLKRRRNVQQSNRAIYDEGLGDPYGRNVGPEDPLPFQLESKDEQTELLALHHITQAAEAMKSRLTERFPFADISWSRQPSFDEGNINELFCLKEGDKKCDINLTDSFLKSHERVRLAAERISQCVQTDDTTKREARRMTRDITRMYTPGDHPEGNSQIRRASIFDPFADFSQMSRSRKAVTGSPAAAEAGSPAVAAGAAATGNAEAAGGEKGIYEDPKKIKKVWAQRHLTYCELQEEEDEERLRLLYQIVHEVYRQFGGKWSNELPPTSALIKLLRKPKVEGLRVAVPNPQSLLNKYIMKPCEAVELVHSLLIPLVMERFYLFDMRFAESPRLLIEEATSAAEWCLATRALSRMGRIANYLLTVILESRVPGLLRLLFRLNGLQFFEYRISYMLHMLSWRGQDNYEPPLEFERNREKAIIKCRRSGTLGAALGGNCCTDTTTSSTAACSSSYSPSSFTLLPQLTDKDRALLLRRAQQQLMTLLKSSCSCLAMKYNVEAICKLLPFSTEYTAHVEKKENICFRLFDSFLTKAFFCILGEQKVFNSPQAASLVTSYVEMLTEVLYAMRAADLLQIINGEEEEMSRELSLWSNLRRSLHRGLNVYLCRTVLCFIADMMYLSCLDTAPILLSRAREMHTALDTIVIPALREVKVQLLTNVTLDFCWKAAVCLRDVFKKTAEQEDINPDTLLPFTLPQRWGLRGGGPWPSLWQSTWEVPYINWKSDLTTLDDYERTSTPRKNAPAARTAKASRRTGRTRSGISKLGDKTKRPPSPPLLDSANTAIPREEYFFLRRENTENFETGRFVRAAQALEQMNLLHPQHQQEQQEQQQDLETMPLYRQWKSPVIPCWMPGCKAVIFQGQATGPTLESMHYCPECHVASYCSEKCREAHLNCGHSEVCCYFKKPPTFLRFHMLKNQIPRQMKYPILDVFHGLCDLNFTVDVQPEDFHPIF